MEVWTKIVLSNGLEIKVEGDDMAVRNHLVQLEKIGKEEGFEVVKISHQLKGK